MMSEGPGGTSGRVLYLTDSLANGGAERQLALLASSLPNGWTPRVVALGDGPYREICLNAGIPVVVSERRYPRDPRPAGTIWRVIREWKPSVVHSWGWMSTFGALVPCRILGIPLVDGTIRNGGRVGRRTGVQSFMMRRCDVVVANSLAGLRAFGFEQSERAHVVYNGFDVARLAVSAPQPTGSGVTSVVMAARMVPQKDFMLMLRVAELLGIEEPGRWRFVLVGEGPMRGKLIEASAKVRGCIVEFASPGTEVLPILAGADIGLLLTTAGVHAEGCSNTILEYLASGLPVVCTDGGGNREVVRDRVTGLLVPASDAGGVSAALRHLARDEGLRRCMGNAARQDLHGRFSLERMVSAYTGIYSQLMTRRDR